MGILVEAAPRLGDTDHVHQIQSLSPGFAAVDLLVLADHLDDLVAHR
jgi:hypothetical protein